MTELSRTELEAAAERERLQATGELPVWTAVVHEACERAEITSGELAALLEPRYSAGPAELAPRCVAHGDPGCDWCSQTAPGVLDEDGNCPDCVTYAEGGYHWDTCPHRIRQPPPEPRFEAVVVNPPAPGFQDNSVTLQVEVADDGC